MALLTAFSLLSCTKTGKSGAQPAAAGSTGAAPAPAAAAVGVTTAATAEKATAGPARASGAALVPGTAAAPGRAVTVSREQPAAPPAQARKDTGVSSLLSLGRADSGLFPEDFKIGALTDSRSGDSDAQQATRTAGAFLNRLVAGKMDASLVAPDAQARVTDTVSFGIDHGNVPRSWRLGAPRKRETGELSLTVRLFGSVGTSEGEITLEHAGKQWLVSDFQISLSALQEKREKPKERFFPSSYRWMLEE